MEGPTYPNLPVKWKYFSAFEYIIGNVIKWEIFLFLYSLIQNGKPFKYYLVKEKSLNIGISFK